MSPSASVAETVPAADGVVTEPVEPSDSANSYDDWPGTGGEFATSTLTGTELSHAVSAVWSDDLESRASACSPTVPLEADEPV